jgi:hypothetical protein
MAELSLPEMVAVNHRAGAQHIMHSPRLDRVNLAAAFRAAQPC